MRPMQWSQFIVHCQLSVVSNITGQWIPAFAGMTG